MKRLVWLLVLAVGTALAQVQPVDVRLVPEEKCPCCAQKGDCGMPDCAMMPVAAHPAPQVQGTAEVSAKRVTAPVAVRELYSTPFLPRPEVAPVPPVVLKVAPLASVPLFKEHCSYLI